MKIDNDTNLLLGIDIPTESKQEVLEKIKKYLNSVKEFCHIISLNPENLTASYANENFRNVVEKAQIRIIDGAGVIWAARLKNVQAGDRYPGVDLMSDLIKTAHEERLRVMLIGGKSKVAEEAVRCQKEKFDGLEIFSLEGIADISNPGEQEEQELFSIVAARRPHLVFVAFGSPQQELWIDKNRHKFDKMVVMGVGGAFDFLSGRVPRAPHFMRMLSLEWLFRLLVQPWRLKRQLKIPYFFWLVLKERFTQTLPRK